MASKMALRPIKKKKSASTGRMAHGLLELATVHASETRKLKKEKRSISLISRRTGIKILRVYVRLDGLSLRKLSTKTETILAANEQMISKQERRLSSLLETILSPNIRPRRPKSGGCQVDSSSWEFLSHERGKDNSEEATNSAENLSEVESDSTASKDSSIKVKLTQPPQ